MAILSNAISVHLLDLHQIHSETSRFKRKRISPNLYISFSSQNTFSHSDPRNTSMDHAAWVLLRTPISAKYCWFGWWLGAWSTPSHDPTQLCDIYISGYIYNISEWTRLFGLLRILDNLISGAVCYFCTTISVFCEIYTLRMRVVAHAAIVWVGWFFMPSSGVGLAYLSPSLVPEPGKFESSGKVSGVGWARLVPFWSFVSTVWTSSPVGWLGGWVVGAGPRGWALAAVVSLLVKGRTWTSLSYWVCVADCQPQFTCFGDSEDLGACVMVSTGRWGLCAFCCWC